MPSARKSPWSRGHLAPVTLTLIGILLVPRSADAYLTGGDKLYTEHGLPIRWQDPIVISVGSNPNAPMSMKDVQRALEGAMAEWTIPSCSQLTWMVASSTEAHAQPWDGRNTVQWITERWSDRGFDADSPAMTDVQYETTAHEQRIVEADIYLNAEEYRFAVGPTDEVGYVDLERVLTHELGHVLGLLHPCELRPSDSDVPQCNEDTPPSIMHPTYQEGASSPQQDDIEGIDYLYASDCVNSTDGVSNPPDGGPDSCVDCCNDAGDQGAGESCDSDSTQLHDFGQTCSSAEQCLTGLCLITESTASVCTRNCNRTPEDTCPSGWECAALGESHVCKQRDSGCTVLPVLGADGRSSPAPGTVLLALIALLSRRRG